MALIPYLLNDSSRLLPVRVCPLYNQHFGLGVFNDLIHPIVPPSMLAGYMRPWRRLSSRKSGLSNVQLASDGFKVNLDVQQFKPEEISVKVVGNYIVVEGKHEEKQDEHGFISRHFQRRYRLSEDINLNDVTSELSSDGVLSIIAIKKAINSSSEERAIPITRTNTPAVISTPQTQKEYCQYKRPYGEVEVVSC